MEAEAPTFLHTERAKNKKETALDTLIGVEFIALESKAGIFLVTEGVKPATSFELLFQPGHPTYTERDYMFSLQTAAYLLDDLNLPYEVAQSEDEHYETTEFSVGMDEMHLEALLDADYEEDGDTRLRQRGLAFGYPETATEAMINKTLLYPKDYPSALLEDDAIYFTPFVFSRDNWHDEIALPRAYASLVKEKMPVLYNKIIEKRRG